MRISDWSSDVCSSDLIQFLQDPGTTPVEVDTFLKNDVDTGKAKNRIASDGFYPRYAQQGSGQGIGDLILDILGGSSRPFGVDDLLVFPQIGNGVDRHRVAWQQQGVPVERRCGNPPGNQGKQNKTGNELILEKKLDDVV